MLSSKTLTYIQTYSRDSVVAILVDNALCSGFELLYYFIRPPLLKVSVLVKLPSWMHRHLSFINSPFAFAHMFKFTFVSCLTVD